jgi:hypothetical protein
MRIKKKIRLRDHCDRLTTVIPAEILRRPVLFCIKIFDDGILIRLLCFWTLSAVAFLFETYNVSETGFCLLLQVEDTKLGTLDRAIPYLRAQLGRFRLKSETESNLRNVVCFK